MNKGFVAAALTGSVLLGSSFLQPKTIDERLEGKTHAEKVSLKRDEIIDNTSKGQYTKNGIKVEIVNIEPIDGGIQVFAKAWKNGKQLSFGDGTVEIERFRIFNPPVLVPDPLGSIEREVFNPLKKKNDIVRFREDPEEALKQSLEHTISLVAKPGVDIVKGKIGNTTDTYFPDPNVETTSVDGYVENYADPGTCSTMAGAADGTSANDAGTSVIAQYSDGGTDCNIQRGVTLFDTSALPDSDTISSAIASLYGQFKNDGNSYSVRMVTTTPASNTALVAADFDQFGTTSLANEISIASFSTTGYNDFTMTDLTQVSKTGVTRLGWRLTGDISGASPGVNYAQVASADTAGTTNDPKLVVTHAAGGGGTTSRPKIITIE